MTDDIYISQNRSHVFYKGDEVVMKNCAEATIDKYKDKIWICKTDSYLDRGRQDVVFLEDFTGCFLTMFLEKTHSDD